MFRMFMTGAIVMTSVVMACVALQSHAGAKDESIASRETQRPVEPALIAVRFHADWCTSCKQLEPSFDRLVKEFEDDRVLFVTLDCTQRPLAPQTQYLAAALRLHDVWKDNAGRTGHVQLIDAQTRRVIGSVNAELSAEQQALSLRTALATSMKEKQDG